MSTMDNSPPAAPANPFGIVPARTAAHRQAALLLALQEIAEACRDLATAALVAEDNGQVLKLGGVVQGVRRAAARIELNAEPIPQAKIT